MFIGRKLIARYVIKGALPYVLLSLVLLTAILFMQQAGRFAELALYADVPFSLAGEIAAALLPSVVILTLPVAVLAGIVIGFARMGSDSEIVAIRAAGVGTWSLLWPALVIGALASGATAYLHLREAPQAARLAPGSGRRRIAKAGVAGRTSYIQYRNSWIRNLCKRWRQESGIVGARLYLRAAS